METPTLEEVKEYFKNAKTIKCLDDSSLVFEIDEIKQYKNYYITGVYSNIYLNRYAKVYDPINGYAEIIQYKKNNDNDFETIGKSITDLLNYKNEKYGQSALNPVNIFNGKTKVGQRLDDKISRIKNSETLRKNDIADVIGYLFLVCKENGWDNFDEFKD